MFCQIWSCRLSCVFYQEYACFMSVATWTQMSENDVSLHKSSFIVDLVYSLIKFTFSFPSFFIFSVCVHTPTSQLNVPTQQSPFESQYSRKKESTASCQRLAPRHSTPGKEGIKQKRKWKTTEGRIRFQISNTTTKNKQTNQKKRVQEVRSDFSQKQKSKLTTKGFQVTF